MGCTAGGKWDGGSNEVKNGKVPSREKIELREFTERIKDELEGRIKLIKLFGSASRGELDDESDLDVLIVTKDEPFKVRKKITGIATEMCLKYGRYISLKIYSQKEYDYLNRLETPFMKIINKEGKTLWKIS
jgi:predicted nucleotidyltransferase